MRVITSDDPRTTARLSVIDRSGSACLDERFPELDFEGLGLDGKAARLAGGTGVLEAQREDTLDEGDAYLGSAIEAATAFGARELHQRKDGTGAVAVGTTLAFPDARDRALTGYHLQTVMLADGRVAQVVTTTFRSVPCASESPG